MKCKETKDGWRIVCKFMFSLFDISRVISSMVRGSIQCIEWLDGWCRMLLFSLFSL